MQKNLNWFERLVRLTLGLFALFAAWQLFANPIARVVVLLFGILMFFECAAGFCWTHARSGLRSPNDWLAGERLYLHGLVGVQLTLAYAWWGAGWEKVSGPEFVDGIAKTLGFFASKNPFPWYKDFLLGFALRNAQGFAYMVEWGEVAAAIVLGLAAIALLVSSDGRMRRQALMASCFGLFIGLLMNANFYLAAGWTGAGTKGDNVVMFWVEAVLLYVWKAAWHAQRRAGAAAGKPQATASH